MAKIISNNEWLIKFEGIGRQYKFEHNGVFSTLVKPIDVSPKTDSESEEEEEEEEEEQERSSEAESLNDLSIEEENEEPITRNSTPAGKNSVSITTGKHTQATDLNADSETTILNGMTIVSSSSSPTSGQRASSTVATGSTATSNIIHKRTESASSTATNGSTAIPNIIHRRTKRSNNEVHHTYLNKNEALSLLSKEIMEFKCLLDNNAISFETYEKWVANAKNTYDAVSTRNHL